MCASLYSTDSQLTLCKLTFIYSIYKDSVRTAQKTHSVDIRNTGRWKMYSEITYVYYACKKYTHTHTHTHINTHRMDKCRVV